MNGVIEHVLLGVILRCKSYRSLLLIRKDPILQNKKVVFRYLPFLRLFEISSFHTMSATQTCGFVLLWLLHSIRTTLCQLTNQYTESIGSNGEYLWQSTSDFIPVQSQSFGEIPIGDEMSAEFDFVWGGRTNDPSPDKYEMFFRVGYDSALGNSCSGQGSRYPSMWMSADDDTLHISASHGTVCQPSQSLADYGVISKHVPYHLLIAFNSTTLTVDISGGDRSDFRKSWAREPTLSAHVGTVAEVWWMSSKFGQTEYNRGNGTFSNIVIASKILTAAPTADPTFSPTAAPSNAPSFTPTRSPSLSPTSWPSTAPTLAPSSSPSAPSPTAKSVMSSPADHAQVFSPSPYSTDSAESEWVPEDNELHHRVEATFFSGDMLYITVAAIGCMVLCCCLILVFCIKLKQQEMVKKRTQREVMSRSSSPYSNSMHSHIVTVVSDRYRSYSGYSGQTATNNTGSAQYRPDSVHGHYGYNGRHRHLPHGHSPAMMPMENPQRASHPSSETSVRVSSHEHNQAVDGQHANHGIVYDFNPKPRPLSPPPILTGPEMLYYSKAQKREIMRNRSHTPRLPPPPPHHRQQRMEREGSTEDDDGVPPGSPPVERHSSRSRESGNSDEMVMEEHDGVTAIGHLEVPEEQNELMMHRQDIDGSHSGSNSPRTPM